MFRMRCGTRGFRQLRLLCCSCSSFSHRSLCRLDDLNLLWQDSFRMVSIFGLPFSLSLRLALLPLLVGWSGLSIELPGHHDVSTSQRRVGSEPCPPVYNCLALEYKRVLFLLLFYLFISSSWVEVDRSLLIHDDLSLVLVYGLDNFSICALYRLFGGVRGSEFRFWIMPAVFGFLNLWRRTVGL